MINIQQEVINGNINPYELLDLWNEKPLDQSDIESLGWVIAESSHKHIRAIIDLCSENKEKWILIYDIKDNYMVILKDVMGMTSFFRGEIKNKSELIKLMQQLNIK